MNVLETLDRAENSSILRVVLQMDASLPQILGEMCNPMCHNGLSTIFSPTNC